MQVQYILNNAIDRKFHRKSTGEKFELSVSSNCADIRITQIENDSSVCGLEIRAPGNLSDPKRSRAFLSFDNPDASQMEFKVRCTAEMPPLIILSPLMEQI